MADTASYQGDNRSEPQWDGTLHLPEQLSSEREQIASASENVEEVEPLLHRWWESELAMENSMGIA